MSCPPLVCMHEACVCKIYISGLGSHSHFVMFVMTHDHACTKHMTQPSCSRCTVLLTTTYNNNTAVSENIG